MLIFFLLTSVAVVLSVTLQLKVFVPHTQFLPTGDPHTQPLQHQQTLRETQEIRTCAIFNLDMHAGTHQMHGCTRTKYQ